MGCGSSKPSTAVTPVSEKPSSADGASVEGGGASSATSTPSSAAASSSSATGAGGAAVSSGGSGSGGGVSSGGGGAEGVEGGGGGGGEGGGEGAAAAAAVEVEEGTPEALVAEAIKGGVEKVLELMEANSEDARIQALSCGALKEALSGDDKSRAAMFLASGELKVLAAMKLFMWETELQSNACAVLGAMASSYASYLGRQGAVEAIIESLRTNANDYQVVVQGVRALQTLISEEGKKDGEGGGDGGDGGDGGGGGGEGEEHDAKSPSNLMRARVAHVAEVLDEIAEKNPTDGTLLFRVRGILTQVENLDEDAVEEAIERAATTHGSHIDVSKKSPWHGLRDAVFAGEAKRLAQGFIPGAYGVPAQVAKVAQEGPKALLQYMVERSTSREPLMWSFDALTGLLAGNEEHRQAIHEDNGISKIVFGLRRFQWDEEVLANGFKALNALASDYPRECGEHGAVEVVLEGMANCDTDYQVQVRGTTCLGTLIRDEENLNHAREHDAEKRITEALQANPEDGQMQWRGIQILEKLKPGAGQPLKQKAIKRAQTSAYLRSMSKMDLTGASSGGKAPVDKKTHEAALAAVLDEATFVEESEGWRGSTHRASSGVVEEKEEEGGEGEEEEAEEGGEEGKTEEGGGEGGEGGGGEGEKGEGEEAAGDAEEKAEVEEKAEAEEKGEADAADAEEAAADDAEKATGEGEE